MNRIVATLALLLAAPFAAAQSALAPAAPGLSLSPSQARYFDAARTLVGAGEARLVTLDASALDGEVAIDLPGVLSATFQTVRDERRDDSEVWAGRGLKALDRALFTVRGGQATGAVYADGQAFALRPLGGGLHALVEMDESAVLARIGDDAIEIGAPVPLETAPAPGDAGLGSSLTVVDVLIAFTPETAAATPDPHGLAQYLLDQTNQYYIDSGIPNEVRLVAVHESGTPGGNNDLGPLRDPSDGRFDEVHAVRDAVGADLVAMIVTNDAPYCGQGYLNSSASYAFSVTALNCTGSGRTMAHELGHNMGSHHDPYVASNAPYAYGYGSVNLAAGWRTVMAYSDECSDTGTSCVTIPYFSTPNAVYEGAATGDAEVRDNVRVHTERAAAVAAFRSALPPAEGSVAPLAFSADVASGGADTAALTLSNADGGLPLFWAATLANLTDGSGTPQPPSCIDGQELDANAVEFYSVSTAGASEVGQTFTVPCRGTLTEIAVDIYGPAPNDGAPWSGAGTLRVYAGDGTDAPEVAAVPFDLTTTEWAYLELALPAPLVVDAGDTVTWFLDLETGRLPYLYDTRDPYAGGTRLTTGNGAPTSAGPASGTDMRFRATFGAGDEWIAVAPASGQVAPGASTDLTLTFDAEGFPDGTYAADLVVTTREPSAETFTVPVTLTVGGPQGISIVIDGGRGVRYLGPPAEGVTVDDLAAQNLVRGVPGYFADNPNPTLWTTYDPVAGAWVAEHGAGHELPLGHAFRWYLLDRDGVGDPAVSESAALPFTLSTDLPGNEGLARITLNTAGNRFNHLANPYDTGLDISGILGWQGANGLARNTPVWTYDDATEAWVEGTTAIGPWEAFRFRARGPRRNGEPRVLTVPRGARIPAAAVTAERAAPTPGLRFELAATAADGRALGDRAMTLAFRDGASAAFDAAEDAEKFQPPATAYALVGARIGATFAGHDARPFGAGELPLAVEARGTAPEMTLSWDASALPSGEPVVLVDLATGEEIDVRTRSSHTFRVAPRPALDAVPVADFADGSAAADRFVLRIGAALAQASSVSEVSLAAPVPNPSAGGAAVRFALPEAAAVRLVVFDARGREVAVLVDGTLAAGRHEAALPGGLAAGVYVVRLATADAVVTQRAAVVR